jgi:hypothetical protein
VRRQQAALPPLNEHGVNVDRELQRRWLLSPTEN